MEQFERLRSLDIDYTISDKEQTQNYSLYEDLYLKDDRTRESQHNLIQDEKKSQRLQTNRIRTAQRRAKESTPERILRLHKNKVRNKIKRAGETQGQRAERNRRNTERNRVRRIRQRNYVQMDLAPSPGDKTSDNFPFHISNLVKVELLADHSSVGPDEQQAIDRRFNESENQEDTSISEFSQETQDISPKYLQVM